ncbi:TPA_asm: polyprotein [Treubia virus 1]|uniref:Replicase n=1 Tax=Treubia virus 1 TaxID=2977996 RepID=A0A9N6YJH0_9RHAB|nr:TPA_asm: polyprotein [Treubia virus 1]
MDSMFDFGMFGDFQDDEHSRDEKPIRDLHLGSAINLDELSELRDPGSTRYNILVSSYIRKDWERILEHMNIDSDDTEIGILHPSLDILKVNPNFTEVPIPIAHNIISVVRKALISRNIQIPLTMFDSVTIPSVVSVPIIWWRAFQTLLEGICTQSEIYRGGSISPYESIRVSGNSAEFEISSDERTWKFTISPNIGICHHLDSSVYYVTTMEGLLLLLDTLGQRICLTLATQVSRSYGVLGSVELETLYDLIDTGDIILKEWGNQGFEIIAMFEALIVSTMLERSPDGVTDNLLFKTSCLQEIDSFLAGLSASAVGEDAVRTLLSIVNDMSVTDLSNSFCLYRIWGHPRVNILEGMRKVFSVGTEVKRVPHIIGRMVLSQFRKMFLTSYFRKHGRYPNVVISHACYITDCVSKGIPINERHPAYSIDDFEHLQLCQIWRVPETYDTCHILNDKAVSPNRSELIENIIRGYGTRCGDKRRGIIRWMEGSSVRCASFLSEVDQKGLEENSLIIGLYEKEREMKVDARMFALMSDNMRTYFVLTEELIANHILPLFPEITMKDSLNVLLKKLWTAGGKRARSTLHVNINVDFSKWNTNMRDDLNNPLFTELDRLFGYNNLIARTHQIFTDSYIYSASGKFLPSVHNGRLTESPPMSYFGHLGGFEGLRQKGWTLTTMLILAYIADISHIKMGLMGQGDNQIVRVYMPLSRWKNYELPIESQRAEARRIADKYVQDMEVYYSLAKMPIKVRETWMSCRLFMYGKSMLHDGVYLPQWYKKVLRSYALSNEGSLTIGGVIGTIATNMNAAAASSESPDIMYVIFLVFGEWSLSYLLEYHPYTRKSIASSRETKVRIPSGGRYKDMKMPRINISVLKSMLLLVPTSIGGSVTMTLPSFIFRGFPDQASEGYSWVKMLSEVSSNLQVYLKNWYTFLPNDTIEHDMLLQSPWSLNHKRPPTPGMQSRHEVRDWLLSGRYSDNIFLSNMRPINESFERKEVCSDLSTDPMNPLISNEIYCTFPHVYLDSILRRVENTRTLKKLILKRSNRSPIVHNLMQSEHNHILYMWWRSCKTGEYYSSCATEQARLSRNIGWSRTIVGVTTPHPLEVLYTCSECSGSNSCPTNDYIYVRVDPDGDFAPYLGSKVKNKVISMQDIEARNEPLISTCARIARYANWIGLGPNLIEVILNNLNVVCDISIYDTFIDDDTSGNLYTGSVDHRFNPAAASEGCFINYAPQVGQRVFMSSDNMPTYGRGKSNYTFHFQAMYCWVQYISSRIVNASYIHYHIGCTTCVVPTVETIPDIEGGSCSIANALKPDIVNLIRSTLGFISTKPASLVPQENRLVGPRVSLDCLSVRTIEGGATWALAITTAYHLTYYKENISESVGLEDLQEHPRIYSFKVHRDLIIYRTALCMLVLQGILLGVAPNGLNMARLKRRVQDILLTTPLTIYKGIGSLCLGRTNTGILDLYSVIVESGSYPETVVSFLKGIKTSMILMVNQIGRVNTYRVRATVFPETMLSYKEHMLFLTVKCIVNYNCMCLLSCAHDIFDVGATLEYPECGHGSTLKSIRTTSFSLCTLDKMFKSIQVKVIRPIYLRHSQIVFPPESEGLFEVRDLRDRTTFVTPEEFPIGLNVIHTYKAIQLPTGSVYKWKQVIDSTDPIRSVVVLGDGTGGTSLVISSTWTDSRVYPCSLLETKNIIPQDSISMQPVLSRGQPNVFPRVMDRISDNIFSHNWKEEFFHEISLLSPGQTLVICDIELKPLGNVLRRIVSGLPEDTHILFKVYMPDIVADLNCLSGLSDVRLLMSHVGNLSFGEFFLRGQRTIRSTLIDRDMFYHTYNTCLRNVMFCITHSNRVAEYIRYVEFEYKELTDMSINLSISHMLSLAVLITKEQLKLSGLELFGYVTQYINTHYKFRRHKTRTGNSRIITPGMLTNLTRAWKIIMCVIFGTQINTSVEFVDLELCDIDKPVHGVCISTRVVPGTPRVLTKKDMKVAVSLMNFRISSGILIDDPPLGWADLHRSQWYSVFQQKSFVWTLQSFSSSECLDYTETE